MIEMTWVADALKIGNLLITLVYFGAAAWLIYVALRSAIPVWVKASCIGGVVVAFGYLPVSGYLEYREKRAYSKAAWERFNKYCAEKAGEREYKKVERVESVLLMRERESVSETQLSDQYWKGDPYGYAYKEKDVELSQLLITDTYGVNRLTPIRGFAFVETKRVSDSGEVSYVQHKLDQSGFGVFSQEFGDKQSRYGFTWEDISTDEDRRYWVAGSRLRVIDLQTNEIISERVGYMLESGFGSRQNGRIPWLMALKNACPKVDVHPPRLNTRRFLLKALMNR